MASKLLNTDTEKDLIYAVDSSNDDIFYVGAAKTGTSQTTARWQIMRVDTQTGVKINYADKNANFDNKWSEREALTYE